MKALYIPRLLIIAGNGRESGKTTLACILIRKFSQSVSVIAVKISPHPHQPLLQEQNITNVKPVTVVEETDLQSGKDSSRMLVAGANRSFFVTSSDDQLENAFLKILDSVGEKPCIICESGGLRSIIEPGLFLIVNRKGRSGIKPATQRLMHTASVWITFDGENFDFDINRIFIDHEKWIIK